MTAVAIADGKTGSIAVLGLNDDISDAFVRAFVDTTAIPAPDLQSPSSLAWSDTYGMVLADAGSSTIVGLDTSRVFPPPVLGGAAGNPPTFNWPGGVTVDASGALYVADTGNARIVWSSDFDATTWAEFGSAAPVDPKDPSAKGIFREPRGIALDDLNRIYVTDPKMGSIVRMDDITGQGWTRVGSPTVSVPISVTAVGSGCLVTDVGYGAVIELRADLTVASLFSDPRLQLPMRVIEVNPHRRLVLSGSPRALIDLVAGAAGWNVKSALDLQTAGLGKPTDMLEFS